MHVMFFVLFFVLFFQWPHADVAHSVSMHLRPPMTRWSCAFGDRRVSADYMHGFSVFSVRVCSISWNRFADIQHWCDIRLSVPAYLDDRRLLRRVREIGYLLSGTETVRHINGIVWY